jgi:glutamate/tyrosine decarboxylase-like PLP-dependent enzyme
VLYASKDCHLAWIKIAHQTGIGRSAVRLVATDGAGRMDAAVLSAVIASDLRAGCRPVMVVATAGTTNAGMIDPLPACARLARDAGAWFHVDAAWGGGLIASERLSGSLAGIERADSITIDAHKWFATTMGCGMFLTPHRAVLSAAFEVSTGYMPSATRDLDPYVTTLQWSRRFLGLRLFLSLAAAGWDGYAAHVEHAIGLTARLGRDLRERGWTVVNRSPLAVLCLEPPPGSAAVRAIVGRVLESGRAWVSVAVFEGRDVIRACVTHGEATAEDADILVAALVAASGPES